jgi:uncharacterized membrane protein
MKALLRRWFPLLLALLAAAISLAVYPRLPAQMVTHWDASGNPNGWMPRALGAFFAPALIALTGGILRLAPRIDPRRANYDKFRGAYESTIAAVLLLLLAVHLVVLAAALGYPVPVARLVPIFVGLLLLFIGNVLPRARSNWLYGIRTPWTLSSDRVWERTHRLAGYAMTAAGVLIILASALLPLRAGIFLIVGAALAATLGPAVYSYFIWKKEVKS